MKSGSSVARWGLAVALLLALTAGSAMAAESQNKVIPPGPSYIVTAQIIPGAEGAEVCGVSGDEGMEHIDFSVGFGDDLFLVVNGELAATFDPCESYTVTVHCYKSHGAWFADTRVVNGQGLVLCDRPGHAMPAAAENAAAQAQQVLNLNVE